VAMEVQILGLFWDGFGTFLEVNEVAMEVQFFGVVLGWFWNFFGGEWSGYGGVAEVQFCGMKGLLVVYIVFGRGAACGGTRWRNGVLVHGDDVGGVVMSVRGEKDVGIELVGSKGERCSQRHGNEGGIKKSFFFLAQLSCLVKLSAELRE